MYLLKEKERKKKLVELSVDEVCSWLETLGMEQYCDSFRQNELDGTELSNLGNDTLATDLGIGWCIFKLDKTSV